MFGPELLNHLRNYSANIRIKFVKKKNTVVHVIGFDDLFHKFIILATSEAGFVLSQCVGLFETGNDSFNFNYIAQKCLNLLLTCPPARKADQNPKVPKL